jgi:hypothetical protein
MSTHHPHRKHASRGELAARAAVVLGLVTAVGLLMAGDGGEAPQLASSAVCPPSANAPFAAS